MRDTLCLVRQLLFDHPRYAGIRRFKSSFYRAMDHMYAAIISEDLPHSYNHMVKEVADAVGLASMPSDFELAVFHMYNKASEHHTLRPFEFLMEETPRRVYEYLWVPEELEPRE